MPLSYTLDGATAPRGAVFTAIGTSVTLTGTLGIALSPAFIISNPSTSTVKVIPLKVHVASPVGLSAAMGFAKVLLGTASLAPAGAGCGGVTVVSVGKKVGTSVAQIWGTATLVNGTAGPAAVDAWVIADLGPTSGTNACQMPQEMDGNVVLLPGESGMIYTSAGVVGFPQITWVEQPLNQ